MDDRGPGVGIAVVLLLTAPVTVTAAGVAPRTSEPEGKFRDTPREVWNVTGMWELLPVREGELAFPPEGDFKPYPVSPDRPWRPYSWDAYDEDFRGAERAWARLRFELPEAFRGRRVEIRFAAVHTHSHLYVNGQHLLDNFDPFTPFGAEISDLLKDAGTNEIVLGVEHYVDGMPMLWPVGAMYKYQRGIMGNVSLIARGQTYIDDLCLRTFVADRRLVARAELRTDAEAATQCRLLVRVLDGDGDEQLRLPEQEVRIEPGETTAGEPEATWPDARFWSPDDPVLYMAVAELRDAKTGTLIDARRERFGFREFAVDGPSLKLNGAKVRLKGIWGHSGEWIWGEPTEPVNIWKTLKAGNFNAARIHGQPLDPELYDAADEVGYLIVDESGIFQQPQTDGSLEHLRRWVRRDRNHPSVVIWSSSNEFRHWVVPRSPDSVEFLKSAYRVMRQEDPTRPIMHHGFGALGGAEEDIINIHYPEGYGLWQVPHSMRWPDNGTRNRFYPNFRWRREKPLAVGEHLLHSPTAYAALVGPQYLEGPQTMTAENHYLGTAEGFRHAMEAYRLLDICHVAPMAFRSSPGGKTIPNGYFNAISRIFRPVGAFFAEYHRNIRSGETTKLELAVYNETLKERAVQACVDLAYGANRRAVLRRPVTVKPGEVVRVPVSVTPDPTPERRAAALVIGVVTGDEVLYADERAVSVYPDRSPESVSGQVALYDPRELTKAMLERTGVEVRETGDPTATQGCDVLVVGVNAADASIAGHAARIAEFVAAGGRVLALEQGRPAKWLPVALEAVPQGDLPGCTIAFPKVAEHPALEGIGADDLRFWQPDQWIAHASYQKPEAGNARVLVESGGPGGLDRALLIEAPHGRGAYILSQFHFAPETADPAQERLLHNLVRYALERPVEPQRSLRVTTSREAVREALASVGADGEGAEGDVWLVDFGGTDLPSADKVKEHLEAGGTTILHGLTPQAAGIATEIVGEPVEAQPAEPEPITWLGGDPTGHGLGAYEILWTDAGNQFSSDRVRHYVRCQGATALTDPPALLVKPVGRGRLIVDQFGWESEQADQARARQYLSTLLTNCGVRLRTASLVSYRVGGFRPIELRPYCNMGFRDDVAGDGVGGWTDEGDNDMRNLPTGRQTFNGVPFDIIDPAANDGKSCIVLTNTRRDGDEVIRSNHVGTTSVKDVPVDAHLSEVHLLMGAGLSPYYSGWAKPMIAHLIIAYEDGGGQTFAIEYNRHVTNWWTRPPDDLPEGKPAWVGTNPRTNSVAIYQCAWDNPFPDRKVRSISFHQGFQCPSKTPVFIAATGVEIEITE